MHASSPLSSFLWALTSLKSQAFNNPTSLSWRRPSNLLSVFSLSFLFFSWVTRWRSRYDNKYFCQSRFWSGFVEAVMWVLWIKDEEDTEHVACSGRTHQGLSSSLWWACWTVEIRLTLFSCCIYSWCFYISRCGSLPALTVSHAPNVETLACCLRPGKRRGKPFRR